MAFKLKYTDIVENIREPYFEVDLDGTFVYINKSLTQMIGYSFDEMIGKNYKLLMDDENKKNVFKRFNSVYESGLPQEYFQFEVIKKGNTKAIVETSVYLNKDTSGRKLGFYGLSRDITKRIKLELKLKQSEEKYRHLFENSPYAIWIVDLKGMIIDCNSSTNTLLSKYTKDDLIGKNFVEILGMLDKPEYFIPFFISKFERFVQDKPMKALEFKMTLSDGIEKWINIRSSKIKLGDETLIQVLIQDITEKKIADLKLQRSEEELKILNKELELKVLERTKELRESEEKFRTIAESSLMGIAIIQDNKIKYVNKQSTDLTGYTVDETKDLSPTKIFEFVHPKDRIWVLEQFSKKQSGLKNYITNYQYRIINKSREIRWLDNYSKTIDYMGKPADLISVIDITERKNAEQMLRESEEKFRTITEYSTIGIVIIQDDKIKYVNNAMLSINEFTKDEMMDYSPEELLNNIHPEDRGQAVKYLKARQTDNTTIPNYSSYRIITKHGGKKWVLAHTKSISFQGRPAAMHMIIDITERRQVELKLKKSEERFKFLVSSNPAIIYTSKVVGDYGATFISDNVQKKWGYSSEDFTDDSEFWLNKVHPDDKEHVLTTLSNLIEKENAIIYDYRFKLKDGTYHWMRDEIELIKDKEANHIELIGSVIDITERKIAEQKLKESEVKYRHLYENSPFSIVLIDYTGKIVDMNTATTKLFGYKKEDLIDKNYLTLADIFPKETEPGLRLVQDLMSKGEPSNPIMKPQITEIFNKEKKLMWVESELSTIKIGGEVMILAIIQDITEKKLSEEKLKESERILRQQNIELKELDRLKTDFISIAAHDLKTPLISVGGYIDLILLREKGLNEEVKEDLNRVLNNVQRLERYINRLLDVMKIDAKKVELVKREENIHHILRNCLSELEFQIGQKNLRIDFEISENLKLRVDHFRISQVFLNLLSNAIKFAPKAGKIDISMVEEDQRVIFKIKDNGKGLTPEEIQKIFGKFVTIGYGVDGYSTLDKGSGLGLYIAKGFIEAHGGEIWVESKGRELGTEFSFTLLKQ